MPGTITFRPIEANLTHNTDLLTKMNPYCSFILGTQKFSSQVCKKGGKHPTWNDAVTVPATNESVAIIEIMDKDRITKDDVIGGCSINLAEIQQRGSVRNWYPLFYKNKPAGEILLESTFEGGMGMGGIASTQQTGFIAGQEAGLLAGGNTAMVQETVLTSGVNTGLTTGAGYVEQSTIATEQTHGRIFTEQHQTVEPHTFMKTVDVVETVPVNKQIEVMEARKVLKDVEYTEAVPVRKTIEVVEPHVVRKEVEVIEPRVVTKTIQVVENVPVKRQVEVVEMMHQTREVETMEPQTFHKQVEVTEHVPVMRTVQVSEPVTVQKTVEFVEPIITTQTITKEIRPEVIIDQKITTEVGPATLVGWSQQQITGFRQYFTSRPFTTLTNEQRLLREQELYSNHGTWGHEERNWRVYELLHGLPKQDRKLKKRQFRDRGINFFSRKELRNQGFMLDH